MECFIFSVRQLYNLTFMRFEDKLKDRIGTDPGFRLPEGSLETLYVRVSESLPERKERKAPKLTMWQRVKPYVYLAAMFAGIWCTVKMFHLASSPEISLDNPPAMVAEAAYELPSFDYGTTVSDLEIEDEVSDSYGSIDEFAADFGYDLRPEYASLTIN